MSRFELKLSDDVIKAIRQRALDMGMRPSEVMEDLVREHFMGAKPRPIEDDDAPLEMKVCAHCACEMPVKCRKCPDCQQAVS